MKKEIKILFVDDEPDILEFMQYSLKKAGYKVFTAKDGEEGITMSKEINPDLIVLDVMMPNMNGLEMCSILKKDEELKCIPILFLTALGDDYLALQAMTAGGAHFITKPVKPSIVINAIGELLNIETYKKTFDHNETRIKQANH